MITGHQLFNSVVNKGIKYIPHHNCSLCNCMVGYVVVDEIDLYFDATCDCVAVSDINYKTWDSAAEWVNMQTDETHRKELLKRFGIGTEGDAP